jgi:hypothetical protein
VSGTYYPYYMKKTFRESEDDIRRILKSIREAEFHAEGATLDDVPLIIKALKAVDPDVRELAHSTLIKLAGTDLGGSPYVWDSWWMAEGRGLQERQRLETGIEDTFLRLRAALMKGDWDGAAELVEEPAADDAARAKTIVWLKEHKKDVRHAYRDAALEHIGVEGDKATIGVVWGKDGYSMNEIPLVRTEDGWRFASLPWEEIVVTREEPAADIKSQLEAHHMAPGEAHDAVKRLKIDEARRMAKYGGSDPLAVALRRTAPIVAALSGIVVAVTLTTYFAQDRDPKVPGSLCHLGVLAGAAYSVIGIYSVFSRKPEQRFFTSVLFLVAAALLTFIMFAL